MKVEIYGQSVELPDPEGGHVLDVLVIARSVRPSEEGLEDEILIGATKNTTTVIQHGMIAETNLIISS